MRNFKTILILCLFFLASTNLFAQGPPGSGCVEVTISMTDAYGDGWNGNMMSIGTPSIFNETMEGSEAEYNVCLNLTDSCYAMSVDGGSWQSEVGWTISDADGNIINYDHPTVIVFSKTKQLSFEELHEKLVPGLNDIYPIQNELFLSNENILKLESEMSQFPLQNLRSHIYSILYWILIIQVLSLLAFPLIFICCRGLFDRGYGLSKLIGLFCLAYISWVTTSVFKVEFTSQLIFFSLSFFALVSGTLFYFYRNELFKFILCPISACRIRRKL